MRIKYDYERKGKSEDEPWAKVNKKEMMKALSNAYIKPELVVDAMHDGMVVNTSFAQYRAMTRYILT